MTTHDVDFTPAERRVLERVRVLQGLESVQDAAEWMLKAALRRTMRGAVGRGRSLKLIRGGKAQ